MPVGPEAADAVELGKVVRALVLGQPTGTRSREKDVGENPFPLSPHSSLFPPLYAKSIFSEESGQDGGHGDLQKDGVTKIVHTLGPWQVKSTTIRGN